MKSPWLQSGHFIRPLRVFCRLRLYCCLLGALRVNIPCCPCLLTSVVLLDIFYVIGRIEQHLHVLHKSVDLVHCGTFGVQNVAERIVGHLSEILLVHGRIRLRQDLLWFQLAVLSHIFHHFHFSLFNGAFTNKQR